MGNKNMTEREAERGAVEGDIPFVSAEPNPFWKKNAEKIVGESILAVEDTAKQFVTITSLLQGDLFSCHYIFRYKTGRRAFCPDIYSSACDVAVKPYFCSDGVFQEKL